MVDSRLLVALILLMTTSTALAQGAPLPGIPPAGATQQVSPTQAPSEQSAPAPAPAMQAAPPAYEPAPARTGLPGVSQDVPVDAVPVPPYPGPVPAGFASASEFVDYGTWRMERLTARERGLSLLGRPENYTAKRVGGFVILGAGVATAVACAGILFLATALPHSGYDEDNRNRRMERGLGFAALGGLGLALGGGLWLTQLRRENPYLDEMKQLHLERKRWSIDVKRARRQARAELRMSFDLTRLQVQF